MGSYQDQSAEITKLNPWNQFGPVESFIYQFHLERHLSLPVDNNVGNQMLLSNEQSSLESCLIGNSSCKPTDTLPTTVNQALPWKMPMQEPMFEVVPGQPCHGSFPDAVQLQLQPGFLWPGRSHVDDYFDLINSANEEEPKSESGEAISQVHIS